MAQLVTLLLIVAAQAAADEFGRYPGEAMLNGAPAAPRLDLPKARRYRTVLREAASEGANFNGHFRIVRWGCGTNCIEWAIIDLADGAVWFAAEPALSCWAPDEPPGLVWPEWIESRVKSRLFYVHRCEPAFVGDRTWTTRDVYEWRNDAAVFLRSERFRPVGDPRGK
jgi:hypothetical protein